MELKRYNQFLSGLNCSKFSEFDHEKEVLFFGCNEILQISSLFQWYNNKWASFRKYVDGIQSVLNVANAAMKWHDTNNMKDIIGHVFPELYFDNKTLPPYIASLLEYHLSNVPATIEYDFVELNDQFEWVKDIFVKRENAPNISRLCNLFKHSDRISIHMPSIDLMDIECCKTIIHDIPNIIKADITIEFFWTSSKPLQLHDIKKLFDFYATEISNVILKVIINEDTMQSIVINCSKFTKHKLELRLSIPMKIFDSTKVVVYGYIHRICKQNHLWSTIPDGIYNICCIFYDNFIEIPWDDVSPFTILFAICESRSALSVKGWTLLDLYKQCQYLRMENFIEIGGTHKLMNHLRKNMYDFGHITNISTSRIENDIIVMLSNYNQHLSQKLTLLHTWTTAEVVMSLIDYLVNKAEKYYRRSATAWYFVEYFRRYCKNTKCDGWELLIHLHSVCFMDIMRTSVSYGLNSDLFCGIEPLYNQWRLAIPKPPTGPQIGGCWYYGIPRRTEFMKNKYPKPCLISPLFIARNETKRTRNLVGYDTYDQKDSPAPSFPTPSWSGGMVSDDEFALDIPSDIGYCIDDKTHSYRTVSVEPFDKIFLTDAIADLGHCTIAYHGLFKVFSPVINSYINVACILTADKLYFVSAIKYKRWEELRDRSNMDAEIKHNEMFIDRKLADKLIQNLNANVNSAKLQSHFVGKTKEQIMLMMILSKLTREEMRSLSTYLQAIIGDAQIDNCANDERKTYKSNSFKHVKYIEIVGIQTICENIRSNFLDYILPNVDWTDKKMIDESMVITLRTYHSYRVIQDVNKRKNEYFVKHKLQNEIIISAYTGNQIPYTFTDIHVIELSKYNEVTVENWEDFADPFGLHIHSTNKTADVYIRMDSDNLRFEWITHLDAMLHTIEQNKVPWAKQIFPKIKITDSSYYNDWHGEDDGRYEERKEVEEENRSSLDHIIDDFVGEPILHSCSGFQVYHEQYSIESIDL